jgi:hypothetical protein
LYLRWSGIQEVLSLEILSILICRTKLTPKILTRGVEVRKNLINKRKRFLRLEEQILNLAAKPHHRGTTLFGRVGSIFLFYDDQLVIRVLMEFELPQSSCSSTLNLVSHETFRKIHTTSAESFD